MNEFLIYAIFIQNSVCKNVTFLFMWLIIGYRIMQSCLASFHNQCPKSLVGSIINKSLNIGHKKQEGVSVMLTTHIYWCHWAKGQSFPYVNERRQLLNIQPVVTLSCAEALQLRRALEEDAYVSGYQRGLQQQQKRS